MEYSLSLIISYGQNNLAQSVGALFFVSLLSYPVAPLPYHNSL